VLTTVAALSRNRVIGRAGQLPWHLPGDMKHFRELTRGGVVVMGRTTFDSIGKPLPQRENWVLSRQPQFQAPGVRVFHDLPALLREASALAHCWVIGGEQIYRTLLPHCDQQWLTEVEQEMEGDSYYPEVDPREWKVREVRSGPQGEAYAYRFCLYERV
jgi:dihydrofolate reductase